MPRKSPGAAAWSALLAAGLLAAGCSKSATSPTTTAIESFVAAEGLPQRQGTTALFSASDVTVFSVAYGAGEDCQAGCIYSTVFGLQTGDKIGWMAIADFGTGHTLSPSRNFDVAATDTVLFRADVWAAMDQSDVRHSWFLPYFLPLLAADADTPLTALLQVAQRIQSDAAAGAADVAGNVLIGNPAIEHDVEILTILANLNPLPSNAAVRSQAQTLLGSGS